LSECCDECFNDKYLKEYIKKHGQAGHCDFCNSDRKHCINPYELHDMFSPLVKLYVDVNEIMPMEELKNYQGDYLYERLNDDWDIFSSSDPTMLDKLLTDIDGGNSKDGFSFPVDDKIVVSSNEYFGDALLSHAISAKLWSSFCDEIIHKNRFFLDSSLEYLRKRLPLSEYILEKGKLFFRARFDNNKKLSPDEMGMPKSEKCSQGRGNPEGIAYLYLASDKNTALAEIKPYVGDVVTIGSFVMSKDLKVVNLINSYIDSPFKYKDNLVQTLDSLSILRHLGGVLSRPIRPEKASLEYLPIQYLCEMIKKDKFDGVMYKSALTHTNGYNLLLFQDYACNSTEFYKVESVKYEMGNVPALPPIPNNYNY
jgi:hypothetical protein